MSKKRKKKNNNQQGSKVLYLIIVAAVVLVSLFAKTEDIQQQPVTDSGVRYELPASRDGEMVIEHTGYTVVFNTTTLCPLYVAWQLTGDEASGDVATRTNDFLPDPMLPPSCQVTTDDYKGSGYDRGHMVPAADMKWSADAMRECFYMSNMCPQNHNLNAGSWQTLEDACRQWARNEGSVYIVCGPIYRGTQHKTIGRNHTITVPEAFFKVVLSLRPGHEKAIGFIYDNKAGKQTMAQTAMSVDDVERQTGLDFFAAVPDDIEQRVEAYASLQEW